MSSRKYVFAFAAAIALGAGVWWLLSGREPQEGEVSRVSSSSRNPAEEANPAPIEVRSSDSSSSPSPPLSSQSQASSHADSPTPNENNQSLLAEAQRLATDYAASFVPGVYGEEPAPQFTAPLLGITAAGSKEDLLCSSDLSCYSKYLRDYSEYRRGLADDWSAQMAPRLRSFFESSPELSRTRVAVSCRASQCKVQMISVYEMPDVHEAPQGNSYVGLANLKSRLKQEAWFQENFTYMSSVYNEMRDISFPSQRILHRLWTLQRRSESDE